jgi:hypothetical protein
LVACVSPVDTPGSTVPGSCSKEEPLVASQKTDILFVVDNSGSMTEEQQGVASELPAFIEELKKGAGAAHDFRVGLITTTVYQATETGPLRDYPNESGRLQPVPVASADGGTAPGTERFLESSDPDLIEKFRRLVKVGIQGSGQETPFEAVRLAVASPLIETPIEQGGTGGFLRDGARLLVVVVTDEDDCSELARPPVAFVGTQQGRDYCGEKTASLTPVDYYAEIFQNLVDVEGVHRPVMWAAIAPVSQITKEAAPVIDNGILRNVDCPTSFQPGHRQREMASRFDQSLGNLDSICNPSYRESLLSIAHIANATQTLEVSNVPDPRLLKVEVTRAGGEVQPCTLANGGIEFHATPEGDDYIQFSATCPRRGDDQAVELKMICAG